MYKVRILLAATMLWSCSTVAQGKAIPINDIDADSLATAQKQFDAEAKEEKEITFLINSTGGSVFDGLNFITHVNESKRLYKTHIVCVVDYLSASMGFVFLEAVCDQRLAVKHAIFLAHNCSSEYRGTAQEVLHKLAMANALDHALAQLAGSRLKMGVSGYQQKVANGDWAFTAEEALAAGAIDGIIEADQVPAPFVQDE